MRALAGALRFAGVQSLLKISFRPSTRPFATLVEPGDHVYGFTLKKKQAFPVYNLTAYLLHHDNTGAEYLHLAAPNDPNKVFGMGFRTNPPDSTGVPHILEHVALCGSEKYPVRDPFFKMLPRSLSNYMNAHTAASHTFYPFATTNKQDFDNLLSVYMDAVLHPRLQENDFRQEGWRLGPTADGNITFKGVVYNEMKGYISDASYFYSQKFHECVAPDLHDSGGNPKQITNLTYEELKAFHAKNYHPSNSKIFTYSDLPLEDHLAQIAKRLEPFSAAPRDDRIINPLGNHEPLSCPMGGPRDPTSPAESQYRISHSWILDFGRDPVEKFSFDIVSSLLLDGYGSPMYRGLIESGIGKDFSPITGTMRIGSKHIFSIGVSGTEQQYIPDVRSIIANTVAQVSTTGFDPRKIDGILHQLDLSVKHKSAMFGMSHMNRIIPKWFDGISPFETLAYQDIVDSFKKRYATPRYLEDLMVKYISKAKDVETIMAPWTGYAVHAAEEEERRVADKIRLLYPNSTKEEVFEAVSKEEKLLTDQSAAPQNLDCLPSLSVADIPRVEEAKPVEHSQVANVPVQWRTVSTGGITYLRILNILDNVPQNLLPLMPLFTDCLMRLGTKNKTMEQLEDEIKLKTGTVAISYHSATSPSDYSKWEQGFNISSYALDANVPDMLSLITTIISETDFDSDSATKKIVELLQAQSSSYVDEIGQSGHSYATGYAISGFSPYHQANERVGGLAHFYSTRELLSGDGTLLQQVVVDLKQLQQMVLNTTGKMRMAVACEPERRAETEKLLDGFILNLPKTRGTQASKSNVAAPDVLESGLDLTYDRAFMKMPFQVSFVGMAVPGAEYSSWAGAALTILAELLKHKHLHSEIREKGGAYGSSASAHGVEGVFTMSSYRDPMPERTVQIMLKAGQWVMENKFTDNDLQEAKLSVFKRMDAPVDIHREGLLEFTFGITPEVRQRRREQLLDVTIGQVREVAQKYLVQGIDQARIMVIGPKDPATDEDNWTQLPQPAMPNGSEESSDAATSTPT